MKRKLALFAGLVLATSLMWVGVSQAADIRTGENSKIEKEALIDGSLYITGNTVTIAGTVKGDVFCAGEQIEITGVVEGDVLCAGMNIVIDGRVNGDVRLAGQNVIIKSTVDGAATIFGQTVTLTESSKIGRDVTLSAGEATLAGHIARDLLGNAESLTISGTVARYVDVNVMSLYLAGKAHVGAALNYTSQNEVVKSDEATTASINRLEPEAAGESSALTYVTSVALGFIGFLAIGTTLASATPRVLDSVGQTIGKRWLLSTGVGVLVLICTPILALLLVLTVAGTLLAVVVGLLWIAALLMGIVFTAQAIGQRVTAMLHWTNNNWQTFTSLAMGMLLLFLVALIPFAGGLIVFIAIVIGVGGQTVALFQRSRKPVIPPQAKDITV